MLLDLNVPGFQKDWFRLDRQEGAALLATLRKIERLDWNDVYRDPGLKWELIRSRTGPRGERVFSIRITQKFRAAVCRDQDRMVFLSLHPDHDSAYH